MNNLLARIAQPVGVAVLVLAAGVASPAHAALDISQTPLYLSSADAAPPLNMLVMGRDHKLYYEAYNDASDLNGDGVLDVRYKPDQIDYFGYFDSFRCYNYSAGEFTPGVATSNKTCSSSWSGDFLNYLTTSRMDALRKVLYGGYRSTDTTTKTVLERAHVPQDAHSWGKEYTSVAVDGYNISNYAPLSPPTAGARHLFANTTLRADTALKPLLRVMTNSPYRIWEWVSIERPVADTKCVNQSTNCITAAGNSFVTVPASAFPSGLTREHWRLTHSSPTNEAGMTALFNNAARVPCTSGTATQINGTGSTCTSQDNYLTKFSGTIVAPVAGDYEFAVDGDDAVDIYIDGVLVASWYGGHGACNCSTHSGTINLTAGEHTIVFRHEEATGGDSYRLQWKTPAANTLTDYTVRVQVCSSDTVLESNCREYENGEFKPTGILHDYGQDDQMYFGLLTGSYKKNLEGGALRKNLSSFAGEIDLETGIFRSDVAGIVSTINKFRTVDFTAGRAYENSTDTPVSPNCGWVGSGPITDGQCRMWGNPVAEMMYETLRYFAGAEDPRPEFDIGTSGRDFDAPLALPAPDWIPPYTAQPNGAGFLRCATPVMTVLSDINPSYDGSLPGSEWGAISGAGDPAPLNELDVGDEADDISSAEDLAGQYFVGEAGGVNDSAPTAKSVTSLASVRGLAPEEPSKQGTYYSASVARFGATNAIGGDKEALTYSVALASPLPRFDFPVGDGSITIVPFAKSVAGGGYGIDATADFQPTNQIVDFYVQTIANTAADGSDEDDSVNNGYPYAEFRINYEDVEQGADHDMDAIVLYTLRATAAGTLEIALNSEYAAGGIVQYMGYVISGTDGGDGVYLEVRDRDTGADAPVRYKLNTPAGRSAGWCVANLASAECNGLPLTATRTFSPGTTAGASLLRDPLWYAAKYGRKADITWDSDGNGEPDNYFLVTNAGTLKEQLDRAFSQIISDTRSSGGVAASGTRREAGFLAYVPEYNSADWTGDLRAHAIIRNEGEANDGDLVQPAEWSAKTKLAVRAASDRDIFFVEKDGADTALKPFASGASGLGASDDDIAGQLGVAVNFPVTFNASTTFDDVIEYLRGDPANEVRNGGRFRNRSSKIGDILGSQPTVLTSASFGYSALGGGGAGSAGESYRAFLSGVKKSRKPVVFVGANDGMLHAFDATIGSTGGDELFSVIPNGVMSSLPSLVHPSYQHRYFVDGSPVQGDAYIGGEWKTVLLTSAGAGGRSVLALDVTNPAAAFDEDNLLWEFSDPDLGNTVGQPAVALLQDGRWVALIGNGVNSDNHLAYLFVVDLATGERLAKIQLGESGSEEAPNGVMSVLAIDTGPESTGADSMADIIYAADYQGNVWRLGPVGGGAFVLSDASVETLLFATGRTITGGLGAAFHHVRGQMVFFGTGRYLIEGDNVVEDSAPTEHFYGVWDENTGVTVTGADLQAQGFVAGGGTSTEVINWSEQKGWRIALPYTGERFIGVPEVTTGRVIFTSYLPVGDECTPGGTNFLNILNTGSGTGGLPAVPPTPDNPIPPPFGRQELPQGGGGPVQSPPVVSTPPEGECDPTDPECVPEDLCSEENPFDCEVPPRQEAKECKTDLGILLSDGIQKFDSLTCGRQSWRQIR